MCVNRLYSNIIFVPHSFKFTKPTAKPSLLPSKPSEPLKQSKSLLQQPLRKVGVPANKVPAIKKNTSLRNQENKGIPFVTSNPPSKVTKRVPVNKSRIRKSSIPKPVAVSDLRKKQPSKDSVQELNATRVVKSASVPVVHSTPIPLKNKAVTDTTPNRRRSLATNSPTDTGEGGPREAEPRIRPSFRYMYCVVLMCFVTCTCNSILFIYTVQL